MTAESNDRDQREVLNEGAQEWQDGLHAFKEEKWEDAVQHLGQALQARIEASGGEADDCADVYYHYGAALFYRAQEESDVFGATIDGTVAAGSAGPGSTSRATGEPGPSRAAQAMEGPSASGAPGGTNVEEQADGEEGDESDENGDEDEADDDMQLAWENLEVAKSLYERNRESHTDRLADIHALLADLAMEQENFESALADYKSAFEIVSASSAAGTSQAQDRKLAELHFKIGLVLQFLQMPEEALNEIEAAISLCSKCLQPSDRVELEESEKTGLQSVLEDLKAKEEELRQAVEEMQKQKETIQAAFQKAFGSVPGAAGPSGLLGERAGQASQSKVVDLGVVGQGRRRINLNPVPSSTGAASGDAKLANAGQPKPKRRLEDLMGGGPAPTVNGATFQQPLTEGQKRVRLEPQIGKRADEQKAPSGKENVAQEAQSPASEAVKDA